MEHHYSRRLAGLAAILLVTIALHRGATADPRSLLASPGSGTADASGPRRHVPTSVEIRDAYRQRRDRSARSESQAYKTRIRPHWLAEDTHFWYLNELQDGKREYILVDAVNGIREPAFDHHRLAEALQEVGMKHVQADRLPIDDLQFNLEANRLQFRTGRKEWECDFKTYQLTAVKDEPSGDDSDDGLEPLPPGEGPMASSRTGPETQLTFVNRTAGEVELFWLDPEGQRRSYGKVAAGARRPQHTYAGHVWMIADSDDTILAVFQAERQPDLAIVSGHLREESRDHRPTRGRRSGRTNSDRGHASPDGRWTAFVKDHNLYVRPAAAGTTEQGSKPQEAIPISTDGESGHNYGRIAWAPDSQTLVAFRIAPGGRQECHLIESAPKSGGRARLHSHSYSLPGDKFATYELNLFSVDTWKQVKPDVEPVDFGQPRLRWDDDQRHFTYEKVDRGHQRFRLIEVDAHSGNCRNILDEATDTFIWTAHGPPVPITTYLKRTKELIYASERDGWRHLYLIDIKKGEIKNQITQGKWVVRGIDDIDEENRHIWFRASGMYSGQDPYLVHCYRINFDGTDLTALTEGNGNHQVQFSPSRKYLIDTWSRVDKAPVHELRRCSDGQRICKLETADIEELTANEPPEVFVARGRDGKTDIWGIICLPTNFDPNRKYPVIEHIYAGPHGSFVPKSFRAARRFAALRDLGFVVVQIDGMGTANRSKSFHDVCWKNLKDAGLPDRILWHKAVAAKYPWYDSSAVGIYGTSAGGQNATAALLFHPEFYQAAVSACGCHDNRLDKASWNEQWMGFPVGKQYAECSNIDHAHRLQGNLLLIVGELDRNVPPESTLRLADALIKAGKEFDLLVVPGGGHGMGGSYGQRRMMDFFLKHLHGMDPPNHNQTRDVARDREESSRTDVTDRGGADAGDRPPDDSDQKTQRAPANLEKVHPASELRGLIEHYTEDHRSLSLSLPKDVSIRSGKLKRFYKRQLDELAELPFDSLSQDGKVDYVLFRNHIERELHQLGRRSESEAELARFIPFAGIIRELADAQNDLQQMDWAKVAGKLGDLKEEIAETRRKLDTQHEDEQPERNVAERAAGELDQLRRTLRQWHAFYEGYDPLFRWWISEPYKDVEKSLDNYANWLKARFVDSGSGREGASRDGDGSDIVGNPLGREALSIELAHEMIPYTPEQLIAIAKKEYAWCEQEMKQASRDAGFGEDWHAALEHVKECHAEPGEQPYLIRDLAREAVEYVETHNLVSVPPLCRDSWSMQMMSPERQRINPFFTGGRIVSVSYPTDGMSHSDKLMSMRGNNIHFARATVHHELIPGHHLQGFMTARYKPYRRLFATPFWTEGWALYWEMLLYERGDFAKSPEDRIGMLFWRMHRCARIIFSLGFHLEQMTPKECIDLLVQEVGHERTNAVAEVRRSFGTHYDPLYQAAYMLGGLQFRALYREQVESGIMTARQFHDAILKENGIPVEMVRVLLSNQPLSRDFRSHWKFYGKLDTAER